MHYEQAMTAPKRPGHLLPHRSHPPPHSTEQQIHEAAIDRTMVAAVADVGGAVVKAIGAVVVGEVVAAGTAVADGGEVEVAWTARSAARDDVVVVEVIARAVATHLVDPP